jgi:hypothetical protein
MRLDVDRLTSLFGGRVDAGESRNIGAAEPCEKMEGASGPTLDLVLSWRDNGRTEKRLIQDPLEEIESRDSGMIAGDSERLTSDDCLLLSCGGVDCVWGIGGR